MEVMIILMSDVYAYPRRCSSQRENFSILQTYTSLIRMHSRRLQPRWQRYKIFLSISSQENKIFLSREISISFPMQPHSKRFNHNSNHVDHHMINQRGQQNPFPIMASWLQKESGDWTMYSQPMIFKLFILRLSKLPIAIIFLSWLKSSYRKGSQLQSIKKIHR